MTCYVMRDENGNPHGFICGDLGPQCSCGSGADFLCDYPVGDDKTCDRNLCKWCATVIFADTHYCRDHAEAWGAYIKSHGDTVSPLFRRTPAASPSDNRSEGR